MLTLCMYSFRTAKQTESIRACWFGLPPGPLVSGGCLQQQEVSLLASNHSHFIKWVHNVVQYLT